jgi:hypothetical protein
MYILPSERFTFDACRGLRILHLEDRVRHDMVTTAKAVEVAAPAVDLPALTTLVLINCCISHAWFQRFVAAAPNLTTLTMDLIYPIHKLILLTVETLCDLTELSLAGSAWLLTDGNLAKLGALPTLRTLRLYTWRTGQDPTRATTSWIRQGTFLALRHLLLHGFELDKNLCHAQSLETLQLSSAVGAPAAFPDLCDLGKLTSLTACATVVNFTKLCAWTHLQLQACTVNLRSCLAYMCTHTLHTLIAGALSLTDSDLDAIAQFSNLQELHLCFNAEISGGGVRRHSSGLQRIGVLSLEGCKVPKEDVTPLVDEFTALRLLRVSSPRAFTPGLEEFYRNCTTHAGRRGCTLVLSFATSVWMMPEFEFPPRRPHRHKNIQIT